MVNDKIVTQLRDIQRYAVLSDLARSIVGQAAAEIERLQADVTRLKKELEDTHAEYYDARRAGWPVP